MKNITLHIIGQEILANILKENQDIIKMDILFFENLNNYFENIKKNDSKIIIITNFSNYQLIEHSSIKITYPIFYISPNKNEKLDKTKFQKCEITYCPFNLKNFVEKINLAYMKSQFADNSKIKISNYVINLNTKEISNYKNKLKLTGREKDFLIFLMNSDKPQTTKNILENVWHYSKDLETHTVETHVHRLRKKFLNCFNDNNFIKNNKKGYYI